MRDAFRAFLDLFNWGGWVWRLSASVATLVSIWLLALTLPVTVLVIWILSLLLVAVYLRHLQLWKQLRSTIEPEPWTPHKQIEALDKRIAEGEALERQAEAGVSAAKLSRHLYDWHLGLKEDFTHFPPLLEGVLVAQSDLRVTPAGIRKYLHRQLEQLRSLRSELQ